MKVLLIGAVVLLLTACDEDLVHPIVGRWVSDPPEESSCGTTTMDQC